MSLQKAIKIAILMALTVIVGLLVIVDGYSIAQYQNSLENSINRILYETADQLGDDISSINSGMYDICSYDNNFRKLQSAEGLDRLEPLYNLEDRLKTLQSMETRTLGYMIFYDDFQQRRYYFDVEKLQGKKLENLKDTVAALAAGMTASRSWTYIESEGSYYAICTYHSPAVTLSQVYCLDEAVENMLASIDINNCRCFLVDSGNVLGDENRSWAANLSESDISYRGNMIYKKAISGTTLTLFLAVPRNIKTFMNVQQIGLTLLVVLTVIGGIFLYRRLKQQLILPLASFTQELSQVAAQGFSTKIESNSKFDEIQLMIDSTDAMIDQLQEQKLKAYENALDAQRAHMQYLSLQLKPHFYLNGLKTLNVLAMNGDTKKIQDMIIRLSEHLRYLLTAEKELVDLSAEVEYVKNYALLQQDMTDRRLNIEWALDEKLSGWQVPNLCIQTFVENSFKYARLGNTNTDLNIYISIQELITDTDRFLDIYIRDNGDGYPKDVLERINDQPEEGSRNVGINNIKRRCRLLYGDLFECIFDNDNGAVSELFIPWKEEKKNG